MVGGLCMTNEEAMALGGGEWVRHKLGGPRMRYDYPTVLSPRVPGGGPVRMRCTWTASDGRVKHKVFFREELQRVDPRMSQESRGKR